MTVQYKEFVRTAAYWRQRADEARAMAYEMFDPTAKATMEDIAHKYDFMAELTTRRARLDR
jgi:hypothetical protein